MPKTGKLKTLDINQIKPYWRNPRNNDETVKLLKESISKYGYNQYICVDPDNVIIVGHAHLRALKELGYTTVDVVEADLDPKLAKEYRIIDNKTSELASWTEDLTLELRELGDLSFMQQFFKEQISLDLHSKEKENAISDKDIAKTSERLGGAFTGLANAPDGRIQDIICPECGHEFKAVLNQRFGGKAI